MLKIEMMPKHYRMFIDYAIKTCDSVSLVFEKEDEQKCEYKFQNEYNIISGSILKRESIGVHPTTGTFFENTDICFMKINFDIASFLKRASSIFDWDGQLLPEELCFYRNESPWFYCVYHERLLFVCNETEEDIKFFRNIACSTVYD